MVRWFAASALVLVLGACSAGDDGGGSDAGGSGGGNEGGSGGELGTGGTGGDVSTGGTGGEIGSGGSGGEGEGGSGGQAIVWESCTLEHVSARAECATLEMPLDRDDPASPRIDFFVRRIAAPGESRGQLWLLEGGPGVNGGQLGYYATAFLLDLGLDIYMPDYRGVGRSAGLDCAGSNDLGAACMRELEDVYGDDLVRFSTSEAVRDVGEAIELLREPGDEVYVWGTSYGTVTAHRFLHLFPDLANGVILDSACGAAGCDMVHADVDTDRNAHDLADLCAADPFCAGKLGADPWAKVADVLDRVERGHCAAAVGGYSDWIRPIFTQLMGPYFMPAVGMATIYRLDRCDPLDVPALQNLLSIFAGGDGGWAIRDSVMQSDLLYFNIVLNEFWDSSYTDEFVQELERGLVASSGAVLYFPQMNDWWFWPRYSDPAELEVWADVDVPVLILNGTLDAQTRHERMIDARDAFTGPDQHVVIVPYGTHGIFLGSAPSSADPSYTCGGAITRQFLADPTGDLDLSCLDEQTPPRFDQAEYQSYWFGTADLYENVQSARAPLRELPDGYRKTRLEQVRSELHRILD